MQTWMRASANRLRHLARRPHRAQPVAVALVLAVVAGLLVAAPKVAPSGPSTRLVPWDPSTAQLASSEQGIEPTYQLGETYGGGSPSEHCMVCSLSDIVGATGGQSLGPSQNVNPETGEFSQSDTLFSVPDAAGPLALTLSYSSLLGQGEVAGGQSSGGTFGYGWKTSLISSVANTTTGFTVNEGNGSQLSFTKATADGCPDGDYQDFQKYTIEGSPQAFCAPDRVDAQLYSNLSTATYQYEQAGGKALYTYGYYGNLEAIGTGSDPSATAVTWSIAPGSGACPTTVPGTGHTVSGCMTMANGGRSVLLVENSTGQVEYATAPGTSPATATFGFTYNSYQQLTSIDNESTSAVYLFGYADSFDDYGGDMTGVADPDANVTEVAYTDGMATKETDAEGYATTYAYTNTNCSPADTTGTNCIQPGQVQKTKVTYQDGEIDEDNYYGGVLVSYSFGTADTDTGPYFHTWSFNYKYPMPDDQDGDTTETVVFPGADNAVQTSVITTDPVGNVTSVADTHQQTTTSMYNDTGGNDLDELCWSVQPGVTIPSDASCTKPPTGSTSYTYDGQGHQLSVTDPLGNTTRYGYYAASGLLCWSAPPTVTGSGTACNSAPTAGNGEAPTGATVYDYDGQGDLTSLVTDAWDTAQTTVNHAYYPDGTLQSTTDPLGNTTSYAYAAGRLQSETTGGLATTYTYDHDGNVSTEVDPNGDWTTNAYYPDGQLCWTAQSHSQLSGTSACTGTTLPSSGVPSNATTYLYDADTWAPTTVKQPNGAVVSATYHNPAYPTNPTTVTSGSGATTSTAFAVYDAMGNTCLSGPGNPYAGGATPSCSWSSGDTQNLYDVNDVLQSTTNADDQTTTLAYGDAAYPSQPTAITSPYGIVTVGYDADGNQVLSEHAAAGSPTAIDDAQSTGYDRDGRVCYQALGIVSGSCPSGSAEGSGAPPGPGNSTVSYDGDGNATMTVDDYGTSSAEVATTTFNGMAEPLSTTDDLGTGLSYQYNALGQITCLAYPASPGEAAGHCGDASGPTNRTVARTYQNGLLHSTSDWLGDTITYAYSTDGNATLNGLSFASPSHTESVDYGYDQSGNLTSMAYDNFGPSLPTQSWTPDNEDLTGSSSIFSPTTGSDISSSNTFEGSTFNRLEGTTNPAPTAATYPAGASTSGSETDAYTYDPAGNIESDTPSVGSPTDYAYNSANQELESSATGGQTTDYAYTGQGQRCWSTTATLSASGCTGAPPSGATGSTYGWDLSGRLCWISDQVVSETGESGEGGQDTPMTEGVAPTTPCPTAPTSVGSGTLYTYNGGGERTTATSWTNGTLSSTPEEFTWDNNAGSLPELVGDATANGVGSEYVYGPLLFGGSAPEEQISTDASGNESATFLASTPAGVQLSFGTDGTVHNESTYTAYGQQVNSSPDAPSFGFDGGYTDSSGLLYFVNRYYDPTTAQFLSVDPESGTPYAFAGDNPLDATDPSGLMWGFISHIGHFFRRVAHAIRRVVHVVAHFVRKHWRAIVTVAAAVVVVAVVTVATAGVGDLALAGVAAGAEGAVEAAGEGAEVLAEEEAEAEEVEAEKEAAERAAAWKAVEEKVAAQAAARQTASEEVETSEESASESATCGGQSFASTTRVKLADGSTIAIEQIHVGDKVLATDPRTGRTKPERVTALWVDHDTDLLDLTVRTAAATSVVYTTQHHLFYDLTKRHWTQAQSLPAGDLLSTSRGQLATVVATRVVPGAADMWDLTVDHDHDFYVSVGAGSQTAVLVHNCGWPTPTDTNCEACARQIQSKIGGDIVRITPSDDPVLGESTNNPAGNWGFHDVVSSGGRVYDGFTGPDGLSPEEFKSQFIHADGIDFGGL